MPLSESHRRNLSVTSRVIEEAIVEIERLLGGTEKERLTKRTALTYAHEKRAGILSRLQQLRRANEAMFREFHLDAGEVDAHQIINAKLSILWTIILDSRSEKLGRYGTLNRQTAESVDRHIDGLVHLVNDLIAEAQ